MSDVAGRQFAGSSDDSLQDNIVTRLQRHANYIRSIHFPEGSLANQAANEMCEAADEIERLRGIVDRLADKGDNLELWARVQHRPNCDIIYTADPICTCKVEEVTAAWREARRD